MLPRYAAIDILLLITRCCLHAAAASDAMLIRHGHCYYAIIAAFAALPLLPLMLFIFAFLHY